VEGVQIAYTNANETLGETYSTEVARIIHRVDIIFVLLVHTLMSSVNRRFGYTYVLNKLERPRQMVIQGVNYDEST
jgi:hypothetical protein